MTMGKIRWGILSTAKIGLEKVIPAIERSNTGVTVGIASRRLEKAQTAAQTLGIKKTYGTYEDLLADPDIDAIYNPLPNHLHVPLTMKAAEAGKHVLFEKPAALNAKEAEQLLNLPTEQLVAEAFMVRAHPQWIKARDIVRSGALGEIRAIQCFFSYFNDDPHNIRNKADIGGGALMDIGCYTMLAGRYFFEAEPLRVVSMLDKDPVFGTDRLTSALLDFGQGRQLVFTVSTQLTPFQRFHIVGTRKRLELVIPVNAPQGEAVALRLDSGELQGDRVSETIEIEPCDQYAELVDAFGLAVLGKTPLPFGPEDAVRNMKVLDALFESDRRGTWVDLV